MSRCELCDKEDELRPYGPNGERICFDCGMKNVETTRAEFAKRIAGSHKVFITGEDGPIPYIGPVIALEGK
jgi:hypothetical protein